MEVKMLYSLNFMMKTAPGKRANNNHRMIMQARVVHGFLIVEASSTGISQIYLWCKISKLNPLKIMTNVWYLQQPFKRTSKVLEISYLRFWCQIQLHQFCSLPTFQHWMAKLQSLTARANCSIWARKMALKIITFMMKIFPPAKVSVKPLTLMTPSTTSRTLLRKRDLS